jgi:Crustacean CHH/MIH/GIH neurohormone family
LSLIEIFFSLLSSLSRRENCFGTEYFLGCVEALKLEEEWEKFEKWRDILGKK